MNNQPLFLKLGGSLITDKLGIEAARTAVLARLADEIAEARRADSTLQIVLGHGSGSFGHVAAAQHGTRRGVQTPAQWQGFAHVADTAARLNRLVTRALLSAGVPAITLSPSASVTCEDGRITSIAAAPIQAALAAGLLPVIHGDVAFDRVRGGTIVSTEEVMMALVDPLRPSWLLLAGETDGVYDLYNSVIPHIHEANFASIQSALGASRGTDVTGGMESKVRGMLDLVTRQPDLAIRIFSGLKPGLLTRLLQEPAMKVGTHLSS